MLSALEEKSKKKQEVMNEISGIFAEFAKEQANDTEDPNRLEFFKYIDDACNTFNECHSNLHQGAHFYTQFLSHIGKITQTINDYVLSRGVEKAELLSRITNESVAVLGPRYPTLTSKSEYYPEPRAQYQAWPERYGAARPNVPPHANASVFPPGYMPGHR